MITKIQLQLLTVLFRTRKLGGNLKGAQESNISMQKSHTVYHPYAILLYFSRKWWNWRVILAKSVLFLCIQVVGEADADVVVAEVAP